MSEKQEHRKKPNICGNTTLHYECPNCHNEINYCEAYCHKCNQALDWSD